MSSAFAAGTLKNLRLQWRRFETFCDCYEVRERFPVSVEVLVAYISWLSCLVRSQGTVRNYVNGIKVMHSIHREDVSSFSDTSVRLTLKGVDRTLRFTPRRAQPITPSILTRMLDGLDVNSPRDATFRALYLISFFLFLRKSNTVPTSVKAFDPAKQLVRGDCKRIGCTVFVCPTRHFVSW